MSDLGKYWAGEPTVTANPLNNYPESGAFHRVDIAGVASSILATPTIVLSPARKVVFPASQLTAAVQTAITG